MRVLPQHVAAAVLYLCLAACGGGGGDAPPANIPPSPVPPASPPPPPVQNEPPEIVFSVSSESPAEGETVRFDVRESFDPDGAIASATVAHVYSLPKQEAVRVNSGLHPEGIFEFLVPEVFNDASALFEITVVDDAGDTVKERAYLTFRNVVDLPKIKGFGDEAYWVVDTDRPYRLIGWNFLSVYAVDLSSRDIVGAEQIDALGDVDLLGLRGRLETEATITGTVQSVEQFVRNGLTFDLQPVTPDQFVVVSEEEDAVHWFADFETTTPNSFVLQESIDIASPCFFEGRDDTGQNHVLIGQRGGGVSVVQIDRVVPTDLPPGTPNSHWARGFEYALRSQAGGSRSLCHILPAVLSERISNVFPQSNLDDLIAVDYDSNELVLLADDEGNDGTYEIVEVVPLATEGTPNLKIIDAFSYGGPSMVPRSIFILLSDGVDFGEHRLIVVGQEEFTNEIIQKTYSWEGGAPSQLLRGRSLFGPGEKAIDYGEDVVIISQTSTEAVILEDKVRDLDLPLGTLPVYGEPQYLEVGEGVGSAITVSGANFGQSLHAIVISYPEANQIKVWFYQD